MQGQCYTHRSMAKRPRAAGITNALLLQHMQGMRYSLDRLETRLGGVEARLGGLERKVTEGFAEVHVRFKRVDDALQRLYVHRVDMLGRIERLEETVGIAT